VDQIVRLIRNYKHVYTDLFFHDLPVFEVAGENRSKLLEKINGVEHKVLLGSDWYMSRM